eukprot:TRINITY_DN42608_c0_g1_i1.p1 TRINITY_DN42608_c0_g1~~TRINITY_DN42608_c0_g1_i1.p1  ORF type:complete len:201 (+),score=9.10 TRINITY_DN42608_c0_g1_i1:57-659(+)
MHALAARTLSDLSLRTAVPRYFSTCLALQFERKGRNHDFKITNFPTYNRGGTKQFKREQFVKGNKKPKYPDVKIHKYGTRDIVIKHHAGLETVPEKIPELIVPDLENCRLKPYVSYATKDIYQEPLTSKDLFNVVYGPKIMEDFKEGKLDQDGNPYEPSEEESLSSEEAFIRARKTGSDIYQGGEPVNKEFMLDYPVGKV